MQWFLILTAAAATLLLLSLITGMLLPEGHTARVSARLPASPERTWSVMVEPEDFPQWRPGVEEVEILDRDGERATRWTERGRTGSMTLEVVERQPTERLVVRIADEDLPFGGTWTYELEPEDGGTRLRIVEDGKIYNPIFRFVARFLLGHDATMRDYLEGLERRMTEAGQ